MSSSKKLIIFDLDDTLIDTSRVFSEARRKFIEFMATKGHSAVEVRVLFDEVDQRNLPLFGYISERNLVTMREAYELLTLRSSDGFSHRDLKQIAAIGNDCLYKLPKPMPYARQVLRWCHKRFRLALLTRGSIALQHAKINSLGVRDLFEVVSVVSLKNTQTFLDVAHAAHCCPEECISIGDSLPFDVVPAFEAGMKAIHVEYVCSDLQWSHDKGRNVIPTEHIYRADNLREVIPILTALMRAGTELKHLTRSKRREQCLSRDLVSQT